MILISASGLVAGCATVPKTKHEIYTLPSKYFYVNLPTGEDEKRPYQAMGWVRSKATYITMDVERPLQDEALCKNYYNKAARDLVREAKKAGADAVVNVRSIVFLLDGKVEEHPTPECSDDGGQGEILLKGIAIKYKKEPSP